MSIYQPKTIDIAIALPVDALALIAVSNALPDLAALASDASVAVAELPVQLPDEPDALPVRAPEKVVAVTTPVTTAPLENDTEPVF